MTKRSSSSRKQSVRKSERLKSMHRGGPVATTASSNKKVRKNIAVPIYTFEMAREILKKSYPGTLERQNALKTLAVVSLGSEVVDRAILGTLKMGQLLDSERLASDQLRVNLRFNPNESISRKSEKVG